MRRFYAAALLVVLFTVLLRADTHLVIQTTVAGREAISAEYRQGKNVRLEDFSRNSRRHLVTIHNFYRPR